MLQPTMPTAAVWPNAPRKLIRPRCPFVYSFALGDRHTLPERILLDEVVCIAVADGTPRPSAPPDWFTARVPAIPPHTGPLHVSGISPGDIVEVEILALAPEHPQTGGSLRATVTIAPSAEGRAPGPSQVVVPANSIVRLPAQRAGGMLSIGPVVLRLPDDGAWVLIDAWVTIRCTVVHSASG